MDITYKSSKLNGQVYEVNFKDKHLIPILDKDFSRFEFLKMAT